MSIDNIFGDPSIHIESFVSSRASVIGFVTVEKNVIIAPDASIRADEGSPFLICKGTNIQDGVIIHALGNKYVTVSGIEYAVYIGSHCSIAHGAIIHGPVKIGKKTFVGFRSTVHHSEVGRNCFIGFHALVKNVSIGDNKYVPDGLIVNSQKIADSLKDVSAEHKEFNKEVVDYNKTLALLYQTRRTHR
jgi:sulfate permease, SulP family